jgi:hypothetical protein
MAGQRDLRGVAVAILKATIHAAHRNKPFWAKIKDRLSRFVKSVQLFGVDLNVSEIESEAAKFADVGGFLSALQGLVAEMPARAGYRSGVFLVLDEINGVASEPHFAHFLKGIVDRNALSQPQVPLCLVLCGTPERRRELIACHEPVGRIFDVLEVTPLTREESSQFFLRAFQSVGMAITPDALDRLVQYGSGQPRFLHMLGDQAFWLDTDGKIDNDDASRALVAAAADFMTKYVGPQILAELRSPDYRSILKKVSGQDPLTASFSKAAIAEGLSDVERKKLDNFLQRMKQLNVLRQGQSKGEWVFNTPMVRTAMFLFAESGE